jgi:hypothetical protein
MRSLKQAKPGIHQGICHFESDRTAHPERITFRNPAPPDK